MSDSCHGYTEVISSEAIKHMNHNKAGLSRVSSRITEIRVMYSGLGAEVDANSAQRHVLSDCKKFLWFELVRG